MVFQVVISGVAKLLYCRDCQVIAWKEGHKKSCEIIRERNDTYNNLAKIGTDAARLYKDELEEVHGVTINSLAEHTHAFEVCFEKLHPWKGTTIEHLVGEPSLENYYKNLCSFARGDWWFYPDASKSAFNEVAYSKRGATNGLVEVAYFTVLNYLAYYDYGGIHCGDCIDEIDAVITAKNAMGGVEMPASTFLHVHKLVAGCLATDQERRMIGDQKYGVIEALHEIDNECKSGAL